MTLSPTTLSTLRELALAATPGPWGRVGVPYYEYWIVRANEVAGFGHKHPIAVIAHDGCSEAGYYVNTQRDANAAYIAAASPDIILSLLAMLTPRADVTERERKMVEAVHEHQIACNGFELEIADQMLADALAAYNPQQELADIAQENGMGYGVRSERDLIAAMKTAGVPDISEYGYRCLATAINVWTGSEDVSTAARAPAESVEKKGTEL